MRKRLLPLLKCPNGGAGAMSLFAFEALAGGKTLNNVDANSLDDDSDIVSGVIVCESSRSAYVVEDSIAVLLADEDIDHEYLIGKLKVLEEKAPSIFKPIIARQLERNRKRIATGDGKWNSDEMGFYDRAVTDDAQRKAMLKEIREKPIWRNFIPREKYIVRPIRTSCQGETVLEIGSGNSRTIANIFRPKDNGYRYVGSDISFKRLLVAKMAIPEGDFVQASAMNLPFIDNAFAAIISFGMLHHLPKPMDAISQCTAKIKKGGYFCFHEPIVKPKLSGGRESFLGKMFTTYQHSEHDSDLDLPTAINTIKDEGIKIILRRSFNSFFKTFAEFVLQKTTPRKFHMSKGVVSLLFFIDLFFLNTFCRVWRGFGPHGVIIVTRKPAEQ